MKHYEDNPMLARGIRRQASQGQAIKVLFKIDLQRVIVSNEGSDMDFVAGISVCFERGVKLAISSEQKTKMSRGQPVTVEFNESLSLVTSLHKDNAGNYREKLGKLIVRMPSSTSGGTGFLGLGMASLPLHRLVADFQSQQFNIPLTNGSDAVGRIDVVITSKFIGEVKFIFFYLLCILSLFFLFYGFFLSLSQVLLIILSFLLLFTCPRQ